jgi:hypothetical protein
MDNTKFDPAFLKAYARIKNPTKNTTNPFLKNKYANLETVLDSVRNILAEEGITLSQSCDVVSGQTVPCIRVITELSGHGGGAAFSVVVFLKEINPNGTMGAFTYGRRYSLLSIFGLAAEDDDAAESSGVIDKANKALDTLSVKSNDAVNAVKSAVAAKKGIL